MVTSDPAAEVFVLRSGVRAGLKREFAFALRSQAELASSSLGRTRSQKPFAGGGGGEFSRRSKLPKVCDSAATPSPVEAEGPNVMEVDKDEAVVVVVDSDKDMADLIDSGESRDGSDSLEQKASATDAAVALDRAETACEKPLEVDASSPIAEKPPLDLHENPIAVDAAAVTSSPIVEKLPPLLDTTSMAGHGDMEEMVVIPPELPPRRITRSMVKASPITKESKPSGQEMVNGNGGVVAGEKPTRRFTRSLLKDREEDSGPLSNSSAGSVDGSSGTSPKKKMELKMSKKISPTKIPGNVRELLATGLLEGLPVKYIHNGKRPVLHGVVKGNHILCSCSSCNGCKAVSPYNFELHAGSRKKHPSDYIYLDNGRNLHDILRACTNATLNMLEAAIQNAIGPSPNKKTFTCRKCKRSFLTPRTGKFALFCDSCLDSKQPKNGTSASKASPRSTRSSKSGRLPSTPASTSQKTMSMGRLTRKDVGLHKLVFNNGVLPEGTEVGYYVGGKRILDGYIEGLGIHCNCCNAVVSPSQFEAHAGRAARRKPYNNIYMSNGVSLHELSVSLSRGRKMSCSQNDDLCSICADGGELLLCDLCPRAFHKECIGLTATPKGSWYCQYCHNLHQRENCLAYNNNAIAAGRIAGVDPIEQIFKRSIRTVTTLVNGVGGCALCKLHDFSKKKFSARTVLLCDQCGKEYHVGCLKEHNMADLKELPEGQWFCSADCSRIHGSLQDLLCRGAEPVPLLDVDAIKKKYEEKGLNMDADIDVGWRLLSGKNSADSKLLLSKAVAIFHESFDPIVQITTGRDLIPAMVYGRTVRDHDYSGMYCAVLTAGSSVVSAALLRVMGGEIAELPLVATSRDSQGLGYFQSLFSCIERLLTALKVKHFVLPAADEAESIWTKRFGFRKITSDQLLDYLKGARTTVFQGTSTLHKLVPVS